jgi:ABC-2 type transport system permease protein
MNGPGFTILLRKELLESWRTYRLPVAVGLFLFTGLSSPVLARFTPEIIELAAGDQFAGIEIPPPVAGDAVDQMLGNLTQFGALAAILLAMGLVASEKDRGTAAFLLAKPVTRGSFIAAKIVAIGFVLALCTVLAVLVGWVYTTILFEALPLAGWAWLALLVWLSLLAYAALTFLGSTLTGSTAAAAGIGFVALIVLSIASAIPSVGQFLPPGLLGPAGALAAGRATAGGLGIDLGTPIVSTVVLIAACIGAAAWSFRRQEL